MRANAIYPRTGFNRKTTKQINTVKITPLNCSVSSISQILNSEPLLSCPILMLSGNIVAQISSMIFILNWVPALVYVIVAISLYMVMHVLIVSPCVE